MRQKLLQITECTEPKEMFVKDEMPYVMTKGEEPAYTVKTLVSNFGQELQDLTGTLTWCKIQSTYFLEEVDL